MLNFIDPTTGVESIESAAILGEIPKFIPRGGHAGGVAIPDPALLQRAVALLLVEPRMTVGPVGPL